MANNTTLNVGTGGDVIATEEISGVKHELVKLEFGTAGNAIKVSASDPLPVTDDAAETSLSSIDTKLSGTLTVDTGLTQPTTPSDTQPVSATDLDIRNLVFASDKVDASGTVLGAGNNNIGDVDIATMAALVAGSAIIGKVGIDQTTPGTTNGVQVNAALPAGSNAIGKLTANDGVDIGDVTINNTSLTVIQGTATNLKVQAENYQGGSAVASGNPLEVNVRSSTLSLATSTKQSDGSQKTQVVDGSGNVIASTSNALNVNIQNASITTSEAAPTTISNGKTTVATAGTRTTLAGSTTIKSVTIKALRGNTGLIYVGNSTVASTNGYQLAAGDSVSMDIANLNTVNIDSDVNGEGVTYIAVN